jgi:hypothetical protein
VHKRTLAAASSGLASLLTAAALTVFSQPASAAYAGSINAPRSAVLYQTCWQVPYHLVGFAPGSSDWDLEVSLVGPDGIEVSSDYLYDADPNIDGLQLCGFEQPGTYTVKATGEWYDDDFNTHPMSLAPAKVAVRRQASHTTAKLKAKAVKKGRVLQVKATVRDGRLTGYFPTSYAGVRLEKRVHRKWSPSAAL